MKLSQDETIFHELKPEPKLIIIWLFTRCLTHGIALAFFPLFMWYFYTGIANPESDIIIRELKFYIFIGGLIAIFGTLISYVYHRYLIKTISYFITNKRCLYKGGILKKVEHHVSYHKITDVERTQNIVEQILELSTISLFTPGTASMAGAGGRAKTLPELRFDGLALSEDAAETINEQVRNHGNPQP